MYRINVSANGLYPKLWDNFLRHPEHKPLIAESWNNLEKLYPLYNAVDVHNSWELDFLTEEDALAFILKFA